MNAIPKCDPADRQMRRRPLSPPDRAAKTRAANTANIHAISRKTVCIRILDGNPFGCISNFPVRLTHMYDLDSSAPASQVTFLQSLTLINYSRIYGYDISFR